MPPKKEKPAKTAPASSSTPSKGRSKKAPAKAPVKRQADAPGQLYQLKVTIRNSKPPIWRRVLVPADVRLYDLHFVMQSLFDWSDCHLHGFLIDKQLYSQREFELDDAIDEFWVVLKDVVKKPGQTFAYIYDFGDDWIHDVLVESIQPAKPGEPRFWCLEGERAGPPEDSGGIFGYYHWLDVIKDKKHEQYRHIKSLMGASFNPDHFDLQAINDRLKVLR